MEFKIGQRLYHCMGFYCTYVGVDETSVRDTIIVRPDDPRRWSYHDNGLYHAARSYVKSVETEGGNFLTNDTL